MMIIIRKISRGAILLPLTTSHDIYKSESVADIFQLS